ncbi:phosphate ABC transporter ATP-binding protein [Desulfurivibrio alkaliphilus]|uniref:ABC transporter related protein n=1 Tax=Desulfurivibrio alkaliphilus (strain DSM 19089 / UNIQEM U267 / AHT2) TaxID=589865 RepID=D6Z1I0_DESAT|nr:phosphate ABC transporter ATP-binding protein [Desulfurivibrio alkaliphilus]ADH87314.1 ABC transporter related protein [Desulfurivibrio alkaliphilus AHT 2]
MENIIQVNNWHVSCGDTPVLSDINLDFPANRITALIGPSGCGKTTLLKSINRLLEEESQAQTRGRIRLQGQDIAAIPKETLRRRVGIVFQTPTPFPFSIEKNMLYALNYHQQLSREEKKARMLETLRLAGLYDEVKDRLRLSAAKLSGGQQQRLCIARSLTLEPEVLLLDEPCSSLDPRSTARIEETLQLLAQQMAVIIVTHNLAQARRIAHHVAFLNEGLLLEEREATHFFAQPRHEAARQYLAGQLG